MNIELLKALKESLIEQKSITAVDIDIIDNAIKELIEHEQCENVRKEWKCDIVKVNEMLRHGYWVKYGTNEKGFTYKHYVPDNENVICLRHLGYDVEICCITSKNEWNAPITGFYEISLSEYGTRLALTKEELE